MKIVICGSYISNKFGNIHEEPLSEALKSYGHDVISFNLLDLKKNYYPFIKKIGIRFHIGHYTKDINKSLIKFINKEKPEALFLYNCPWIKLKTLESIKPFCRNIMVYCNDDPFSKKKFFFNRNIRNCYKVADTIYSYRPKNIENIKEVYNRKSKLLLPSFARKNFLDHCEFEKIKNSFSKRKYDISFIGHFENDNRKEYLISLIKSNKKILIAGDDKWNSLFRKFKENYPNLEIKGFLNSAEYVKSLSQSKSALCLFSSINSDILTRRVFEIPASGSFLICPNSYLVNSEIGLKNYINFKNIKDFTKKINNIEEYLKNFSMLKECHNIVWKHHNSLARFSIVNNDLIKKLT